MLSTAFAAIWLLSQSACAAFHITGDWLPISGLAPADAPFQLVVSNRHRHDFAVFAADSTVARLTDAAAIDQAFDRLHAQSDAYCRTLLSGGGFQDQDLALLTSASRDAYTRNRRRDSLYSLRAGCRNFFEMNDLRPDRDFELVRRLYPNARFDCYSVGLLQPYIMHTTLNCRRLTMLDINWRILDLHNEILRRARSGAFADARAVDRDLSGIQLQFPALHERPLTPRPAAVRHLCRPIQHEYCRRVLPEFRGALEERPASPGRVRLNLSTLHAGAYEAHGRLDSGETTIRVVYLSNAIEESYTSREEFDRLLANLRATAAPEEAGTAVDLLIHHVGGWKLFGLYEIAYGPTNHDQNQNERSVQKRGLSTIEPVVRTICKDAYLSKSRSTAPDGAAVEYTTHFERRVGGASARAPTCGRLYAETEAAE